MLSAWTAKDGSLYALAEIDVKGIGGAVAAAGVDNGRWREFSLGYTSNVRRAEDGRLSVHDRKIKELSIVGMGARPNCKIQRHAPY